jgi:hypothetical protein
VDVGRIAPCPAIAFNRSYVAWQKWGFDPTYYACLDPMGLEGNAAEIRALVKAASETRFFLGAQAIRLGIGPAPNVTYVNVIDGVKFSTDLSAIGDFGNVGATSLQILAHLGFCRVGMVGVDGRYPHAEKLARQPSAASCYSRVEHDSDHFSDDYGQGKRRPASVDLGRVLGRWSDVAEQCRLAGLNVRNASPGTALTCFPRAEFDDVFHWVTGSEVDVR